VGSITVELDANKNSDITNFEGLAQVIEVFGDLYIKEVMINDLTGLEQLEVVKGSLRINDTNITDDL